MKHETHNSAKGRDCLSGLKLSDVFCLLFNKILAEYKAYSYEPSTSARDILFKFQNVVMILSGTRGEKRNKEQNV